jgi:L-fuculose-phosphate aldolase
MAKRKDRVMKKSSKPSDAELKRRLAVAGRILAMEGQGDAAWGHATVRLPGSNVLWMKPAGMGLEEVKAEEMLLIDLEGRVVRGKKPRHIEVFIHSEIMRARPDVCAVVHTHAVFPTVFAALGVPLRPVTHEGVVFVPPDIPRFDETTDLINTPERGKAVARTLGDRNALILLSHGIVTAGASIEEAAIQALLLDKAARDQLLLPGAIPRHWSTDADALAKRELLLSAGHRDLRWGYLLRKLKKWKG